MAQHITDVITACHVVSNTASAYNEGSADNILCLRTVESPSAGGWRASRAVFGTCCAFHACISFYGKVDM